MRYRYAVVEPLDLNRGVVKTLHKQLFNALRTRQQLAGAQGKGYTVRELVADAYKGDTIRYEHLRRWDS